MFLHPQAQERAVPRHAPMPIIDTVVLTFVYVERLRMDKDEQRKQAAASGGGP